MRSQHLDKVRAAGDGEPGDRSDKRGKGVRAKRNGHFDRRASGRGEETYIITSLPLQHKFQTELKKMRLR